MSISERLREGICDDRCRVRDAASGCDCAEAADVIDALVEALDLSLGAVNAAYQQSLAEAQGHDRIADRHDKVVVEFKIKARAALASASPLAPRSPAEG